MKGGGGGQGPVGPCPLPQTPTPNPLSMFWPGDRAFGPDFQANLSAWGG